MNYFWMNLIILTDQSWGIGLDNMIVEIEMIFKVEVVLYLIWWLCSFFSRLLSSTLKLSDDIIFFLFLLVFNIILGDHQSILPKIIPNRFLSFLNCIVSFLSLNRSVNGSLRHMLWKGSLKIVWNLFISQGHLRVHLLGQSLLFMELILRRFCR